MSLPLTPARLKAVYDCLRAFPPFNRMRLPPSDEIKFRVTRHQDREAHFRDTIPYEIAVSEAWVGSYDRVVQAIAHENIHLYQAVAKTETANTIHNAEFHRIAKNVCRKFGWDYKNFVR